MYPRAPQEKASPTRPCPASVVIITTGTPRPFSSDPSWRTNSRPSMPGMLISHSTRSARVSRARARASQPSLASITLPNSTPAIRNERSTIFLITAESSTISTRFFFMAIFPFLLIGYRLLAQVQRQPERRSFTTHRHFQMFAAACGMQVVVGAADHGWHGENGVLTQAGNLGFETACHHVGDFTDRVQHALIELIGFAAQRQSGQAASRVRLAVQAEDAA